MTTMAKNTLPAYLPAEYAEVLALNDAAVLEEIADAMEDGVFGPELRDVTRADYALALLDFLAKAHALECATKRLAGLLDTRDFDEALEDPLRDVLEDRVGDDLAELILPTLIWNLEQAGSAVENCLQWDLDDTLKRITRRGHDEAEAPPRLSDAGVEAVADKVAGAVVGAFVAHLSAALAGKGS